MINGIPKISVLIICYKQEELIKRAINSLLVQKDYIYEICVSDDCSPDSTWEVLQEYDKQYSGLFKLHRNDPNIGIFENIEQTWMMPTGDIVYRLAGDDECGPNWLKTVVNYIQDNNIDYKNELFCIYGNFKSLYPNGDEVIFRNKLITSGLDPIYLSFRTVIGNRSACYSRKVLQKFEKVSQGRSHIAEFAQEIQLQLYSSKNYYIPQVGNIYYANVGISNATSSDKYFDERQQIVPYAIKLVESKGIVLDKRLYRYYKANNAEKAFYNKKNPITFIEMLYCKLLSYDSRIGLKSIGLKRTLFAIFRRFPHSKPISWYV